MAQRTAVLDYRTTGTSQSRSNVVSLTEAIDRQKRAAEQLSPAIKNAGVNAGIMGAMFQSATARISSTTNTLGPLGAGLGAVARLAPQAGLGLVQMAAAGERANVMSRALNTTMLFGTGALIAAGVAAASYADDVIRAGDSYSTLQARIRTFSSSAAEAAGIENEIYDNARNARTAVADLTTLYVRLAPAMKDVGRTQADAMKVTELTSKALAVQGADVREQAASTVQLSQALASGVLRGDELRSLMEAAPQLMRFIAEGMGVPFSALRKLGAEGKLTTDKIVSGLLAMESPINSAFATAPKTAAQAWQVLQDQITRTVGTISQATGLQKGVFDFLDKLSSRADDYRIKVLADPSQLDTIKETAAFLGDAVGLIGSAGAVAASHFDEIVMFGQALIALKLGETLAAGFTFAATKSKALIADTQAFAAAARFNAGAATAGISSDQAAQAIRLKAAASFEAAKAADLSAAADAKAALASDLRAQADRASTQAQLAKASGSVSDAAALSAETAATNLNTRATRAKDAADRAAAQAEVQKAAATAVAMEATAAEAVVTAEATAVRTAGNFALRAASGLYTLLGGAVGIAAIAVVGGMMLMAHAAAEAEKNARNLKAGLDLVDVMAQEAADSSRDLADGLDSATAATNRAESASRRHAAALADERKEIMLAAVAAAEKGVVEAQNNNRTYMMAPAGPGTAEMLARGEADMAAAVARRDMLQSKYYELAAKGSGGGRSGGSGTRQGSGGPGGYTPPAASPPPAPDTKGAAKAARDASRDAQQAADANERWADRMAEVAGETRSVVKAEREVNDLRKAGATITDDQMKAYLDFIRLRESARRAAAAVQFDSPLAGTAADKVMAGSVTPTTATGAVDLEAATRQLQARRAEIIAETEAQIRIETEREVESGQMSREESELRLAERIAAGKVAVEAELQDRILKLTKQRADDQAQIDEARAKKAADTIEGAFHDLVFGGDFGDLGKRLVNDLLEEIYQELIGNPMRKVIHDLVQTMFKSDGAGGGGGVSTSGKVIATALSVAGHIFGFDEGGYTGDAPVHKAVGVVHGREYVINATSTAEWLPFLEAINSRKVKPPRGYRGGGLVGMAAAAYSGDQPYPSLRGQAAGIQAGMAAARADAARERPMAVSIGHIDASVNAPFAESAQLRQVVAQQQDMKKALPDLIVAVVRKTFGRT
jgi:tape measure domain-containing protein